MAKREIYVLYSTFAKREEAISAARALLEARLVACANILPAAISVYCWEDKIAEESEVVMIAKTSVAKLPKAIETLKTLHSYAIPCITAWPVTAGQEEYLAWVIDETT
jgi:periplasmic divalent cation tolerance protein